MFFTTKIVFLVSEICNLVRYLKLFINPTNFVLIIENNYLIALFVGLINCLILNDDIKSLNMACKSDLVLFEYFETVGYMFKS